jgi:hypothetical protein
VPADGARVSHPRPGARAAWHSAGRDGTEADGDDRPRDRRSYKPPVMVALLRIRWCLGCVSQHSSPAALSLSLSLSPSLCSPPLLSSPLSRTGTRKPENVGGTTVCPGTATERDIADAGAFVLSAAVRPRALWDGQSSAAATYVAHSFFLRSLSFVLSLGAFSN